MAKRKTYKPRNSFIYEGYEGPDYLCYRKERKKILSQVVEYFFYFSFVHNLMVTFF